MKIVKAFGFSSTMELASKKEASRIFGNGNSTGGISLFANFGVCKKHFEKDGFECVTELDEDFCGVFVKTIYTLGVKKTIAIKCVEDELIEA